MSLSCSCFDIGDHDPGTTLWYEPRDYGALKSKTSKKCCSCEEKIKPGDVCCEVPRYKIPKHDVEISIYGEDGEIPRASKWMCERCADIAFSLDELGFCHQPWEDQRELAKEYAEVYGKKSGD